MAWPPDVADGQVIAAAHINAIKSSVYSWQGDVDALDHKLLRVANIGLGVGVTTPLALLHIAGIAVGGIDSITGIILDRAFDAVGDSMDIVWGATGNRAGRISCLATAGGEAGLIFYAQTGAGDGYSNEVMRILGTGEVSFSKTTFPVTIPPVLTLRNAQQYALFGDRGVVQSWPGEGIGGTRLGHNVVHHGGIGDKAIATGGSSWMQAGMDGISFFCQPSYAAGTVFPAIKRMQITDAGIVQLWLGGSLKTLSVDGSGFVKAA